MKFWVFGLALVLIPTEGSVETIRYGDNSSLYANDRECDDPRFRGTGMSTILDEDDKFRDAADCKRALSFGQIELWNEDKARRATDCSAIDFGDNSSEWSGDGECDDYRFIGRGMSSILDIADTGRDARDCRNLCKSGKILLRDY